MSQDEHTKMLITQQSQAMQKQLSDFVQDIKKTILIQVDSLERHQREDRENFEKVFKAIKEINLVLQEQNATSKEHRDRMEPIIVAFEGNKVIARFFVNFGKLLIFTSAVLTAVWGFILLLKAGVQSLK